jgi:hypothetical protein
MADKLICLYWHMEAVVSANAGEGAECKVSYLIVAVKKCIPV